MIKNIKCTQVCNCLQTFFCFVSSTCTNGRWKCTTKQCSGKNHALCHHATDGMVSREDRKVTIFFEKHFSIFSQCSVSWKCRSYRKWSALYEYSRWCEVFVQVVEHIIPPPQEYVPLAGIHTTEHLTDYSSPLWGDVSTFWQKTVSIIYLQYLWIMWNAALVVLCLAPKTSTYISMGQLLHSKKEGGSSLTETKLLIFQE